MYTTQQIAEMTGGTLHGNHNRAINRLLTDSRALSFPEDSLFIAIVSDRNNGHKYIPSLYKKNVRSFMVSHIFPEFRELAEANFIVVEDTLKALQELAAGHRKMYPVPVIGITGSNGKTIVKEWLYQLLHADFNITRSPRSYNSQIGVPLSVWEMNGETELGIFEAGVSQPGEMERIAPIIAPTIGIFTNLGEAHQENFLSLKVKCLEKLKLFEHAETLIYNKDDKLTDICMMQARTTAKFLSFGTHEDADIQILSLQKKNDETIITYLFKGEENKYAILFTDNASVENSMQCLAVLLHLNISGETIRKRMATLEPVAMRLEVKEGQNGCLLINDSYNSDINSLGIALDFLSQQADVKQMKKTLILSDIMQSGQDPAVLYQSVSKLLFNKNIERLIGIGHGISAHAIFFPLKNKSFFPDTETFLRQLNPDDFKDEAILLKGSRSFRFEEIFDQMALAVHETVLEVDLNALINNFNYFRSFLQPGTKTICMVKANAYGSGDIEVARTLQHNGCDYLAVAVADEGAVLRREGIDIPIVVMNPETGSFHKILENNLEPEIYSFRLLEQMISEAERQGINEYPVHIKIDTGMHRLGFEPAEIDRLIDRLKSQKNVMIRSVFSHLAGADDEKFDAFTEEQINRFKEVKEKIDNAFPHKIIYHILNSAGTERFSQYQFDMVRLGIGLYGISAVNSPKVEEVSTLKTNILQIKRIPATETTGYSRKGTFKRDSVIGVLPVGYADGYNRKFGNGEGKMLINGQLVPVVGNICMDLCMIDLTGIEAQEGDSVTVFGKGYSFKNLAAQLNTIPYEILSNVSRRVKRVYFKE
ncbi:MAG: bifunctional UDP-N-acetylmuramoyl-tripeptide:D-alanyl-D-alanine ligase/alanine racemase [Prevotellaceae bacterium]|jgi:alanine racemase|nr:bifunctional UDP-N-acetylmuramoyl-tripeptide:D-alanyl-D-alanine ligase/alanine racemase [Prevotellaceae bacterium]